jgi:DNA-binding transcriptional LysR family regulator
MCRPTTKAHTECESPYASSGSFATATRHLSYSKARRGLHRSRSAASIQVRQLKEDSGNSLFERLGRKVNLTDAGRESSDYYRSIGGPCEKWRRLANP